MRARIHYLFFYLIKDINHRTQGKNATIIDCKIRTIRISTIGVKSRGQIVVGIVSFTFLYIGSKIDAIKTGLIFNQTNVNQESITSAIII
jgi:hypothetical protein